MKKIAVLFLAIALLSMTSPALAEDKPANYVALKGGVYSPSTTYDLNNFNGGSSTHLQTQTGFDGEIALGHYIAPALAIELGAGYFESKGSPATPPGETKLKVVPVLLTGKLLLPLGGFEPYGEFGIGAYFSSLDVTANQGTFNGSGNTTYGLHAGAGFNIDLSESVFFGVEGRYLWAKPSFGGQDININGFTATADLGFRF